MSNLILPTSVERTIPDWFLTELGHIDPALIVYFNPLRGRWILDRCTRDDNMLHQHTPACPKTNVRVIQDADGSYMPLCQDVLDWLRAHDTGSKFKSADEYIKHLNEQEAAERERIQQALERDKEHNSRDHRVQLNQLHMLIQRHDLHNIEQERIDRYNAREKRQQPPRPLPGAGLAPGEK